MCCWISRVSFNTSRPRQNGRHFADDTFKRILLNENVRISIRFSLNFYPNSPINNIPALVQIMAWRRPGGKPLSEPMMVRSPTHICVTRPLWFNNVCVRFQFTPMKPMSFEKLLCGFADFNPQLQMSCLLSYLPKNKMILVASWGPLN